MNKVIKGTGKWNQVAEYTLEDELKNEEVKKSAAKAGQVFKTNSGVE